MRVEVWTKEASQPIIHEAYNAYCEDVMYCVLAIEGDKEIVHKYPVCSLFRVIEDYEYEYGGSQTELGDLLFKRERERVAKLEKIVKLLSCVTTKTKLFQCFGNPSKTCCDVDLTAFMTKPLIIKQCKACVLLKEYEDVHGEIV
jgi:hypothetical protein